MNNSELRIYQSPDGRIKVDVRLEDETVWLTQAGIAELFQVKPQNITIHLKNIHAEGELAETATCKDFLHIQAKGTNSAGEKFFTDCRKYTVCHDHCQATRLGK